MSEETGHSVRVGPRLTTVRYGVTSSGRPATKVVTYWSMRCAGGLVPAQPRGRPHRVVEPRRRPSPRDLGVGPGRPGCIPALAPRHRGAAPGAARTHHPSGATSQGVSRLGAAQPVRTGPGRGSGPRPRWPRRRRPAQRGSAGLRGTCSLRSRRRPVSPCAANRASPATSSPATSARSPISSCRPPLPARRWPCADSKG